VYVVHTIVNSIGNGFYWRLIAAPTREEAKIQAAFAVSITINITIQRDKTQIYVFYPAVFNFYHICCILPEIPHKFVLIPLNLCYNEWTKII